MTRSNSIPLGSTFRNIFIVESRAAWSDFSALFDPAQDLLLTYDFALCQHVAEIGGAAFYIDHLCDQSFMQENNFLMYQFFRDWHYDSNGEDIFRYREIDFGFSFRIDIWNDFTFYVRSRLCLDQLQRFAWQKIYIDSGLSLLCEVLTDMGLAFEVREPRLDKGCASSGFFFPIHRWMDERLRLRRPKHVLRDIVVTTQGIAMSWLDRLADAQGRKKGVFVQEYHPTRQLLQRLMQQADLRVVLAHFSSAKGLMRFFTDRPIPIYGRLKNYQKDADRLIEAFRTRRSARLVLANGVDITDAVNRAIERKISMVLPESIRALHCVINYLNRHQLKLEILIGNIGKVATLVDCVAKSRGVPSLIIINGLLGNEYMDEAKYATVINGYSKSIRDNYFRDMENVICLGDPRMDDYSKSPPKRIDRIQPTITIGASGFNHIDLNSFLAVEFEFLREVLSAIRKIRDGGQKTRVLLKVRPNGYREQYQQFTDAYFPGLVDLIADNVPIRELLDQTDLYISIYSQTLFEASCLGIPVIYHKTDCEIMDAPFDGKSELVTTHHVSDLEQSLRDFLSGSTRFAPFLDKRVMEQYIGPLDGRNLERNVSAARLMINEGADAAVLERLKRLQ